MGMEECNTNDDNLLTFKELIKCMKEAGNVLLKYAYIPEENIPKVAEGIEEFTKGRVSAADAEKEIEACNTNEDQSKLHYREIKNCLVKHQKVLGLTSQAIWNKAKWSLSRAAVINMKGLKKAEAY